MLVEVHDEEELEVALEVDADVIGINNRDLDDFTVDIERTYELLSDVPAGKTVVSESGFSTREQLDELERVGVDAVLIGETLMRAPDIEAACRELTGGGDDRPVPLPLAARSRGCAHARTAASVDPRARSSRPPSLGGGVTAAVLLGARRGDDRRDDDRSSQPAPRPSAHAGRARRGGLTARDIYRRDAPGVVYVRARRVQTRRSPFDALADAQQGRGHRLGLRASTATGTILTNAHVVAGATDIAGDVLRRQQTVDAQCVGKDDDTDLALLRSTRRRRTCSRSSSATPPRPRSATRRWRSATRSASTAR